MISAKLDQLKPREKIGLLIAVLCLVLVLVDRLAVRMVLSEIQRVEFEITEETAILARNLALMAAEPAVTARYEPLRPRLGTASSVSVARDRLQGRIDELAHQYGLEIQSMRDRPVGDGEIPGLRVAVEIGRFEADVEALLEFLVAVQQAPEVWRVSRLSVAPDQSGRLSGSMLIAQLTEREME